jgi:3-oxosteroid 1-dehydrogenase
VERIRECDVVVVGSGAGGLLTAVRAHDLGLNSLVIEKCDRYGGTSAVSGGGLWIPNNPWNAELDSPEKALTYLEHCTEGKVPREKLRAYVEFAPVMFDYLTRKLGIGYFYVRGYADYRTHLEGAMTEGRTCMPLSIDGRKLGADLFRLRRPQPYYRLFGHVHFDIVEMGALILRMPGWKRTTAKLLLRYALDFPWRLSTSQDRRLTFGNALVGGLRLAMLQRNVPLYLESPLKRLIKENGRIVGVVVSRHGNEHTIMARRAVVLASGGFEKNRALRERYMPEVPTNEWTIAPSAGNVGDGLLAAMEVGADTEFLSEAWWVPSIRRPAPVYDSVDMRVGLFNDRGLPHSVCVNRLGRRFANESMNYSDFGYAMIADNRQTGANQPCWLVFDAQARYQYPLGSLFPSLVQPDSRLPQGWLDNVLYSAPSIAELAGKIDVDAKTLADTVGRMNEYARTGVDAEFGRGGNAFDQFCGDPRSKPNCNLGSIDKPPYYALRLDLGDTGTKGGPKVDRNANVLATDGRPIPGLYAVGNVSGSVMAASYPGAGATLGPALTFGYIAAEHIARTAGAAPSARILPLAVP